MLALIQPLDSQLTFTRWLITTSSSLVCFTSFLGCLPGIPPWCRLLILSELFPTSESTRNTQKNKDHLDIPGVHGGQGQISSYPGPHTWTLRPHREWLSGEEVGKEQGGGRRSSGCVGCVVSRGGDCSGVPMC